MRVALLTGLILLALAAPAQAGWRMQRSLAIAEIVWNHPCNDQIQMRWVNLPPDVGGETRLGGCVITMDSSERWNWPAFCRVVIHEVGHAAGVPHSTNPHSVMWPQMWRWFDAALVDGEWISQRDRRCQGRGRPYLEQHGAL